MKKSLVAIAVKGTIINYGDYYKSIHQSIRDSYQLGFAASDLGLVHGAPLT